MKIDQFEIYVAVIITVLLTGIILLYFSILVIRQHVKNLKLQQLNAFAEIAAMEKERARIAADLHDELGPLLSVIKFRIENEIPSERSNTNELRTASKHLDEVIAKLREISNNLIPTVLLHKGAIAAINYFISQIEPIHSLHIDVEYPPSINIGEDQSIQIYRILHEVINNCIKHAKATKLLIVFKLSNNLLTLTCEDNGIGLVNAALNSHSFGRGINSMKYRTEMMSGHFNIEAEAGVGTILTFEIPIK
jgi:signal transduction histidine kinase